MRVSILLTSNRFGWAFVLAALALACGSPDETDPTLARAPAPIPAETATPAPTAEAGPGPNRNRDPEITWIDLDPDEPRTGQTVRAIVEASDPDKEPIWYSFQWTLAGQPIGDDAPTVLLRDASKGAKLEVVVVASDGKTESDPLSASAILANTPPRLERISVQPSAEIAAGTPIVVRPVTVDPDGDDVRVLYEWWVNDRRVAENGSTLSTEGLQRGSRIRVRATAYDGQDESEPVESPELVLANTPPQIVVQEKSLSDDGVFQYVVRANDPDRGDQEKLQFRLADAPVGMEIDGETGAIRWVPTPEQVGTATFTVVVDDSHGGQDSQRIEVNVGPTPEEFAANPN